MMTLGPEMEQDSDASDVISAPTWERGAAEKKGSKYIFFIPINESPIIGETKTIVK